MTGEAPPLSTPYWRTAAVAVRHVDLRPDPAREARAFAFLDREERRRFHRFRSAPARRRFVLTRGALREELGGRLGRSPDALTFGYGVHGKPFLRSDAVRAPSFNASHSTAHGLLAFARRGAVGVDVEERVERPDLDDLAEAVLGRRERSLLGSLSGEAKMRSFWRLWTMKEALVKALGGGFAVGPARLELPPRILAGAPAGIVESADPTRPLWLRDLGEARFAAAVAWRPDSHILSGRFRLATAEAPPAIRHHRREPIPGGHHAMATTDERLTALTAELLDIAEPSFDTRFTEAGISSANAVAFFKRVAADFGLEIAPERFCDFQTLRDLANFLDSQD